MKQKTLKVYAGPHFYKNKLLRFIVAAHSKKQAIELAEISSHTFRDYWCETGNKRELETATEVGVWIYDGNEFLSSTPLIKIK